MTSKMEFSIGKVENTSLQPFDPDSSRIISMLNLTKRNNARLRGLYCSTRLTLRVFYKFAMSRLRYCGLRLVVTRPRGLCLGNVIPIDDDECVKIRKLFANAADRRNPWKIKLRPVIRVWGCKWKIPDTRVINILHAIAERRFKRDSRLGCRILSLIKG